MAYYAGKNASITIQGISYPMDTWDLSDDTEEVDVTNFTSGGIRELIAGIYTGSMSTSGPYNGTAPTTGTTGTIIFNVGGGVTASRKIFLNSVKTNTAVKDKATLSISGSITA